MSPTLEDREQLYTEVLTAWQKHKSLDGLPKRSLLKLPYALFWNDNSKIVLVENQELLNAYLGWLKRSVIRQAVAAMLDEFLFQYDPAAPWFKSIQKCLSVILSVHDDSPRIRRMASRCKEYHFLEDDAPKKFGIKIFQERHDVTGFLTIAGLSGRRENGGFVEHVFLWFLEAVKVRLSDSKPIRKGIVSSFLEFAICQSGSLRFEKHRAALINSLLEPFGAKDDPMGAKKQILPFLIEQFGDPRINHGKWSHVSQNALAVIHRWLVKGTLEDFFVLLEKVADQDDGASRMWRYRKAFWSAYLNKNVISNAWVVLGRDARRFARQYFKGKIDKYGSLVGSSGSSVSSLHSVLLMEIGGLLVAEWSHSGKCHVWHPSEKPRPIFYSKEYGRDDLTCSYSWSDMDAPPFFHHGSERGTWQNKISSFIRRHTNITLMSSEFMPRD
ncbi:EH signature domain-containing protein [Desulfuromusa kysingii]|nr:EH signature domain-containing protein [Desulfuromusa kysingii]